MKDLIVFMAIFLTSCHGYAHPMAKALAHPFGHRVGIPEGAEPKIVSFLTSEITLFEIFNFCP